MLDLDLDPGVHLDPGMDLDLDPGVHLDLHRSSPVAGAPACRAWPAGS